MTDEEEYEEDNKYFAQGHSGFFMEDFTVYTDGGMGIDLFECKVCVTLTKEPRKHIEWHTQ